MWSYMCSILRKHSHGNVAEMPEEERERQRKNGKIICWVIWPWHHKGFGTCVLKPPHSALVILHCGHIYLWYSTRNWSLGMSTPVILKIFNSSYGHPHCSCLKRLVPVLPLERQTALSQPSARYSMLAPRDLWPWKPRCWHVIACSVVILRQPGMTEWSEAKL